jgi:hypothetical protein
LRSSRKTTESTQLGSLPVQVGFDTRTSKNSPSLLLAQLAKSVHVEKWCTVAVRVRRSVDSVLGTTCHPPTRSSR